MNQLDDTSSEHSEIIKVIERETEMFVNADFDGWASCWVQDERTRVVCFSSTFGATVLEGWQAVKKYYKDVIENGFACDVIDFQRDKFNLTKDQDMACVTFDGLSVQPDKTAERTFETRVLQCINGEWRILYSSFLLRGHQIEDANRIAIDSTGMVLCAPEQALTALQGHQGLRLSHGRLRATKPDWDEILQAGIKCAAEQHQYFQHYRYTRQNQGIFRLPIVLGELEQGGVAYCTLFVRDEMTFVEIQSVRNMNDRLNIARAIFSLSKGQLALVHRIVSGESLVAAADTLGISINSVRTQLSRIYIKTGVNSQTALVRTLLSVG